jgi:hypothetical protein
MTDGGDFQDAPDYTVILVRQGADNRFHCFIRIADRGRPLERRLFGAAINHAGTVKSDALNDSAGKNSFTIPAEESELDGGAAGVDNENGHVIETWFIQD